MIPEMCRASETQNYHTLVRRPAHFAKYLPKFLSKVKRNAHPILVSIAVTLSLPCRLARLQPPGATELCGYQRCANNWPRPATRTVQRESANLVTESALLTKGGYHI